MSFEAWCTYRGRMVQNPGWAAYLLRLARGMTYKAAAAGLDLGGGKAVIFGDPTRDKTEARLRAYARHVDALGGRYLTAEDIGTTQDDMDLVRRETRFVTGVSRELGGSGDPSTATGYGVLWAMKAVARHLWGDTSLAGRHVAVAGVRRHLLESANQQVGQRRGPQVTAAKGHHVAAGPGRCAGPLANA